MRIDTESQLRELYGYPKGRAKTKQLDALESHAINFIEKSPFVVISTVDVNGNLDSSPRGGAPGFVKVIDQNKIIIPDSKGNNRLDSFVNIIETKKIGCLFLIPGVDETLRINGSVALCTHADYLAMFSEERNPPKCVIEIDIKEIFLHCAKALMRSKLWSDTARIDRTSLPTMAQMLNDQLGDRSTPESQEAMIERYKLQL